MRIAAHCRRTIKALLPPQVLGIYRARGLVRQAGERMPAWELRLLQDLCPRGGIAVDVGANVGGHTWNLARIASHVHAFEPQPDLAGKLRAAYRLSQRIRIHDVALSDRRETVTMRVPIYRGNRADGLATIEAGNALSGLSADVIVVRTAALDDFALSPQFVKIDVEGHELAVLRGAARTLQRSHPALLIEAEERHRPNAVATVADFLRPLGYQGWFSWGQDLLPVEAFDPAIHQPPGVPDVLGRMNGRYTGNFVFKT